MRLYRDKKEVCSDRWKRGGENKGVVFYDDPDRMIGFNPYPGHVVASLDKILHIYYLRLVASNKQQIQRTKFRRSPQ